MAFLAGSLAASAAEAPSPYGILGVDFACPTCGATVASLGGKAKASSTLVEGKLRHDASHAFDEKDATAWCEGVKGTGVGESLEVTFPKPIYLEGLYVKGGYFKDLKTLKENGRVSRLTVKTDAVSYTLDLANPTVPGKDEEGQTMDEKAWFARARDTGVMIGSVSGMTKSIKLTVEGVYPGSKYEDTCISSINLVMGSEMPGAGD